MSSTSGLGPYCTAAGLTAHILKNNGPFPTLNRIANGVVIELAQYGRIRKINDSQVESWVAALGKYEQEKLSSAVWQLFEQRKTLRRKRQTAQLAILECAAFEPDNWSAPLETTGPSPVSSVERQQSVNQLDDSIELQRKTNLLTHDINVKEQKLKRLTVLIQKSKEEFEELQRRRGHYGVRNVNKREERHKKKITLLQGQIKSIRQQFEHLQTKTDELTKAKVLLQKRVSKYRQERKTVCTTCPELREKVSALNSHVQFMESKDYSDKDIELVKLKDKKGAFSERIRLCVCDLVGLQVATENISKVIISVSQHLFNCTILPDDLPCRNTCVNIANEGAEIVKSIVAQKFEEENGWGIHKDGTSRKKRKILDTVVNFPSGEEFSLGFSQVSCETAKNICDVTVGKVEDLKEYADNKNEFVSNVARKLVYFMNDRAANEKKSNELLLEWRDGHISADSENSKEVHNLFCMAHVLLGFHNYVMKGLQEFQKEISADGSGRLGRHEKATANSFKALQAASRVCCSASDVFAPIGNHLGMRDIWEAYCKTNNITSWITNYRDNRFNGLFQVSASISHHHTDFIQILSSAKEPNAKIRGLLKDLQDPKIILITNVLGLVYAKITDPFWRLVTRNSYTKVICPLRQLHSEIFQMLSNPARILSSNFPSLQHYTQQSLVGQVTADVRISKYNTDYFNQCVTTVLKSFHNCMAKQLSDILSEDFTDSVIAGDRLQFAPATNLNVERQFGHLDASQRRRPNAKLRFHSAAVSLKKHRKLIAKFMTAMPSSRKAAFNIKVRYMMRRHRQETKARESKVLQELLTKISKKDRHPPKRKVMSASATTKRRNRKASNVSLSELLPSSTSIFGLSTWIAVAYPEAWYPGLIMDCTSDIFIVDFAYPRKAPGDFSWPDGRDKQHVQRSQIIAGNLPITATSGGRFFHVDNHAHLSTIFEAAKKTPDFFLA